MLSWFYVYLTDKLQLSQEHVLTTCSDFDRNLWCVLHFLTDTVSASRYDWCMLQQCYSPTSTSCKYAEIQWGCRAHLHALLVIVVSPSKLLLAPITARTFMRPYNILWPKKYGILTCMPCIYHSPLSADTQYTFHTFRTVSVWVLPLHTSASGMPDICHERSKKRVKSTLIPATF